MVRMSEGSRQIDEALWDVADVAAYLKVSEATIRLRILNDEIPYLKIGRLIRFRRPEIDAWIQQQQPESAASNTDSEPAA